MKTIAGSCLQSREALSVWFIIELKSGLTKPILKLTVPYRHFYNSKYISQNSLWNSEYIKKHGFSLDNQAIFNIQYASFDILYEKTFRLLPRPPVCGVRQGGGDYQRSQQHNKPQAVNSWSEKQKYFQFLTI